MALRAQVSIPHCHGRARALAAIQAVHAANAHARTLARYNADLDAAYEQARANGDLTPLTDTVRRWWFDADAWRDPAAHREYLGRVEQYLAAWSAPGGASGQPGQIRERYGV